MKTIFEKIIERQIPAHIVYEDDLVIAFLDIQQVTKGHTLVVPKVAYPDIFNIPFDLLSHVMEVSQKICKALKLVFNSEGINLLNNNGAAASQTVFHFHFHLIPRYTNDSVKFGFKDNSSKLSKEEYEKRASLIKTALS